MEATPARRAPRTGACVAMALASFVAAGCSRPIAVQPLTALPADVGGASVQTVYRDVPKLIGRVYALDVGFLVSLDDTWQEVKVYDVATGQWVSPPLGQPRKRSIEIAFGGRLHRGKGCA